MSIFFKTENNVIKVACPYLRIYIPNSYFEEEIAELVGTQIETIGIFYMSAHNTEDEPLEKGKISSLKLPSSITISPTRKEKMRLFIGDSDEIFTVLYFTKGEIFLPTAEVLQTPKNTLSFINLLHYGKLPANISYPEIITIYRKNLAMNNVNLKVPSVLLESIISELCRSKNNRNLPYRLDKGKGFTYAPIKMLPHLNSTFASLSFEDPNKGIALSIKRTKDNKEQALTSVEKVIKY
jgi:hypothetical protein